VTTTKGRSGAGVGAFTPPHPRAGPTAFARAEMWLLHLS
jgi:hypothetical protein